jgi:ribosome biogenesis GTPase
MSRRSQAAAGPTTGNPNAPGAPLPGRVVAAHGRHYLVAPEAGGAVLQCFPRGKKSVLAVGDRVLYEQISADQGAVTEILPRRNLLYRSDQFKAKLFAANLDQLLVVVATEPWFGEELLGRALIAADIHGLTPRIVLNKIDLPSADAARARLAPHRALGYEVDEISVRADPDRVHATLMPWLHSRATLLLGQSGMGKSSLVNLLVPDAQAATREFSTALNAGRHTTTFTRLYDLPGGGALIDSPGFQEFGLHHITEGELERAFPEFRPLLPGCRFYNCHHLQEPGCAVLAALAEGRISPERHALYARLVAEIQVDPGMRSRNLENSGAR